MVEHASVLEVQPLLPDEVALGVETILVAEDDKMVRELTIDMLTGLGYQVPSVESLDCWIEV